MIENSSSILEILAGLYITLAFDVALYGFVQRFNVRRKLETTILSNLRDSDRQKKEVEEFVESLCKEYNVVNN